MGTGKWSLKRSKDVTESVLENRTKLCATVEVDPMQSWGIDETDEGITAGKVPSTWQGADAEKEKLRQAFEKFDAKQEKSKIATASSLGRVDIGQCNLNEVLRRIREMTEQHQDKEAKGAVWRTLRSISACSGALQQWVNLLPCGDYGSVIAGSFKLFLSAAERSEDIRKDVQEVMQEIPDIMSRNRDLLDVYSKWPRETLTKAVGDLFEGVFKALRLVVEYLTSSSVGRALKAFGQGDYFGSDLKDSIRALRRLADNASKEAEIAHQDRTRRIEETVESVNQRIDPLQLCNILHEALVRLSVNPTGEIGRHENPRFVITISENEQRPEAIDSYPVRKKLLRALEFDTDEPVADIAECRSAHCTMSLHARDEANYILRSKELKRWLIKTEKSRVLLVDGNRPGTGMHDISPVSLVCAELMSLFSLSPSAVVVSYFCGLHAEMDEDKGADWVPEMIKSLICQLLAQPKDRKLDWNLSFISAIHIKRMRRNDLDTLLKVFHKLVLQLPTDQVFFCIIDSISRFEATSRSESDSVEALTELTGLLNKKKGPLMKLLLTCPCRGSLVGNEEKFVEVVVRHVLTVPDGVNGALQGVVSVGRLGEYIR